MHMSCAVASVGIRKSRVKAELSGAQDTACTWKTVLQPGQQDDQYKMQHNAEYIDQGAVIAYLAMKLARREVYQPPVTRKGQ